MKKLYTYLFLLCASLSLTAQAPPPKFLNDIVIPPKIVYNGEGGYDLDAIQTTHNFNPHDPSDPLNGVTTFCFEDFNNPGTTSILGPTINWEYKVSLNPTVLNRLSEVTTCHWHGAHVPHSADGGPYQRIQPNTLWEPSFQVLDKSATMWYHPHAMDLTYKHVQMGMSGMIYVEDPTDDPNDPEDDILVAIHEILPTDYNVDDFPLIFQTKKFAADANGQMQIQTSPGFKDGYEYMVNGIIDPVLTVPANMVRLRILNGDGKFSFNFSFKDKNGGQFPAQMIATDAGYMDRTYQIDELLMAPGERTEWLLDLRGLQGDTLYVRNVVSNIPDGAIGNSSTTNGYAADRDLLKIVVGPPANVSPSPIIAFPISLLPSEAPPVSAATNQRTKNFLSGVFNNAQGKPLFSIDSALMDMTVVNDVVDLDAIEIWTLHNQTGIAHPWHIHDIHFWVTEVVDSNGVALDKAAYPQLFAGPKDNVLVQPGWQLSYIGTFDDFGVPDPTDPNNSYMYHCHILPHEDNGMMGTFVVWDGTPVVNVDEVSGFTMQVMPNPAQNIVYLRGESLKVSTLRLLNMSGQLLKEMTLPAFKGAIEIEVNQMPEGMLILDWLAAEGRGQSRVMITH